MTLIDSELGFTLTVGFALMGMSNSSGTKNETALIFKVARQPRKGILSFSERKGLMRKQRLDCEMLCFYAEKKSGNRHWSGQC